MDWVRIIPLMSETVRLCSISELPGIDQAKEFAVGENMVCVANVGGELSAMSNVCTHRGGTLGQGVVLDGKLVCPWHGWMFDTKTGVPDEDPHKPVPVYRLRIDGEDVYLEM